MEKIHENLKGLCTVFFWQLGPTQGQFEAKLAHLVGRSEDVAADRPTSGKKSTHTGGVQRILVGLP